MSQGPVDVSHAQDGGIMKNILEEGSGDCPVSGNEVEVHYTGRLLDGKVFDSSKTRGEFFKFKVGTGQVIKGWDQGILTMKRGEVCLLHCKPEYAYGSAGSPPTIAPNQTLEFEVEMHDFFGEDCTDDGSGGVRLTTTKEPTGLACPREGSTVTVSWVMHHMDRELEKRSVTFVLGDGSESDVVPGVEMALLKMKKGQAAKLRVKAFYAYHNQGNADLAVPGGADLEYQLTLDDFEQAKYKYEMSKEEKIDFAESAKEMGTLYFKRGDYHSALKKYAVITEYLEEDGDEENMSEDSDNEKIEEVEDKVEDKKDGSDDKVKQLQVAAYLNQGLCHLKMKSGLEACTACDKALVIDPTNVKALYRKGQAAELGQDWSTAEQHYRSLLKVDASNALARKQIVICRNNLKTFKEQEKKKYAGMFNRTNFKEPEIKAKEENKTRPDFSDDEEDDESLASEGGEEVNV